jgi:hypothetical protein
MLPRAISLISLDLDFAGAHLYYRPVALVTLPR